jgi:hypothetical protein
MAKEGMVDLYVPLDDSDRKNKYMILGANDEVVQLERGKTHKVSEKIKREFERKERMKARRNAYKDRLEAQMQSKRDTDGKYAQ